MRAWRQRYGASPLHLLALIACFAVAGYAALRASAGPLPLRMLVWFVAALIAHDLVLFPLYALADRGLTKLRRGDRTGPHGSVNWVRVPAIVSGVLFLISSPLILRRSEDAYGRASGLNESPYLGRWLVLTAILFGGSALLFAVRSALRRH